MNSPISAPSGRGRAFFPMVETIILAASFFKSYVILFPLRDLSVLQETPFTDQGSIVEVFTDLSVWMGIRKIIEQVNANAVAA